MMMESKMRTRRCFMICKTKRIINYVDNFVLYFEENAGFFLFDDQSAHTSIIKFLIRIKQTIGERWNIDQQQEETQNKKELQLKGIISYLKMRESTNCVGERKINTTSESGVYRE